MSFREYYFQAKNSIDENTDVQIKEIEIKEILAVGSYMEGDPTGALVLSTEGDIWLVNEGKALISRHDLRPGMKLTLGLKEKKFWKTEVLAVK